MATPTVVRLVCAGYVLSAVVGLALWALGIVLLVSGGSSGSEIVGPLIGTVEVSEADNMTWIMWLIPVVILVLVSFGMCWAISERAVTAWTAHSVISLLLIGVGILQSLGILRGSSRDSGSAALLFFVVLYFWYQPEVKLWFNADRRMQAVTVETAQE